MVYMNELESDDLHVRPREENGRKHPCMMNIFRETNKIVEIEFIHNEMTIYVFNNLK